jgi:carboxypeptidase PM20D1
LFCDILFLSNMPFTLPALPTWQTAAIVSCSLVAGASTIAVVRAISAASKAKVVAQAPTDELHDAFVAKKDLIASRLSAALQLRTVSFDRPEGHKRSKPACSAFHQHDESRCSAASEADGTARPDALVTYAQRPDVQASLAALLEMHALLEREYPLMHKLLHRQVVNKHSLVFVWKGSDPTLQAVALYAHMDVVPADDAAAWEHGPFSGLIKDGYVWGRGAIDDKQSVIGICEAIEHLLSQDFRPKRTIIAMFGHDEEIGGEEGAAHIASWIEKNVAVLQPNGQVDATRKPVAFLLDEGLFVLRGAVPGMSSRTALICTAEKGFVNVELAVEVPGGHASTPPKESAIGILANAVSKLEANPFPPHFSDAGPVPRMFEHLLPYLSFPFRLIFANLWLTGPLVERMFAANPKTAVMVRTTTAPTIFQAGIKVNTLPPTAKAFVNHRIHPSESVASVLARDERIIADTRITLRPSGAVEPSPVSDDKSPAFQMLADAVEGIFADTVAAPALMVGATDSHWSEHIAENMFRHCPTELHLTETPMFHGRNERIAVNNLARIAAFYARVLLRSSTMQTL